MFSSDANYSKLKTNLRLALNRLKLLEKKKAELAQKARKEIADMVAAGKSERAKIRVEQIIREDYFVEALEIVEMFCDALLSRFGLLQQSKTLDPSLAESVSSLIWVAPHIQADVCEMKIISDQLTRKFGKKYMEACRSENMDTVSGKLKHKLSLTPPPKVLVEKYLIEISKNYNVSYKPDLQILSEYESNLTIDTILDNPHPFNANITRPTGFIGFPQEPLAPIQASLINYPSMDTMSSISNSAPLDIDVPPSLPQMPTEHEPNPKLSMPDVVKPVLKNPTVSNKNLGFSNLPEFPVVPTDVPNGVIKEDDIDEDDFDELLNRFEDLKKNKN